MRAFAYFFGEAAESLWRSRHAAILSTLTIAAGLFVLGFFVMVNANLQRIVRQWTDAAELSVYLRDDARPEQVSALNDMIARSGLASSVQFVSKADARTEFSRDFPDLAPAAAALDRNPFPASFAVRLNGAAQAATAAIDNLVIITLMAIAAAMTVANVVRLAAMARQDEIAIMQLVGAPFAYIRGPFIAEGLMQGGVGALIAVAALLATFAAIRARYGAVFADAVGLTGVAFVPMQVLLLLVVGGMALGCLGGFAVARAVR